MLRPHCYLLQLQPAERQSKSLRQPKHVPAGLPYRRPRLHSSRVPTTSPPQVVTTVRDEQLLPGGSIPASRMLPHDVPVDIICTPTQVRLGMPLCCCIWC